MPENSNEPDNYTIDDMIDRLKKRSGDGIEGPGELVTRADGTQAIRVRKRKRRSHQPHKDEQARARQLRIIQVSGAFLLVVLVGLAAGGGLVFGNSPFYRNRMLAGARVLTGADVDMREFRVNPKTANASSVDFSWPEGNVLRSLALRSLTAEIHPASFLGRAFTGEELTAGRAELGLDFPVTGQPRSIEPGRAEPMDIRFLRYAAHHLNLVLGPKTSPVLQLRESEFILQDRGRNSRPLLLISRGMVTIPGAPALRIDRGHLEFRDEGIDVTSLRLLHEKDNRGYMKLSGNVQPYDAARQSTLAVSLDDFAVDSLVGEPFGKVLNGRVDTVDASRSNFFSFTPAEEPNGVLAVSFESASATPFEVKGFPAFLLLARLLDDHWFENPVFESDVRGTVRRADGEVAIGNLECENRSRISLRMNLRQTADNRLDGTMRLGLADGILKAAQNRRLERVFDEVRHGFHWVELAVSGRPDAPYDNFSALYDAAAAGPEAAIPGSTGTPSFEELTKPE